MVVRARIVSVLARYRKSGSEGVSLEASEEHVSLLSNHHRGRWKVSTLQTLRQQTKPASRHLADSEQLVDVAPQTQYLDSHSLALLYRVDFWSRVIDWRSIRVVFVVSWQVLYFGQSGFFQS